MYQFSAARKSAYSSSKGGVIIEFAMVIPFLLLVFGGILGLGRAYAQLTWVSNSSYEIALAGAGNPEGGQGDSAAQSRNTLLGEIPYYSLVSPPTIGGPLYNQFGSDPLLENTVLVRLNAELPILFARWVTSFRVDSVLPILVLGRGTPGSLTRFENARCLYDCDGAVIDLGGGVCCQDPSTCMGSLSAACS